MKRWTEPEWLKLGDAAYTHGLSVSEIFRACMTEDVLSVHIVKAGNRKGTRLVNRNSLDEYIRSYLPGGSRYHQALPPKVAVK